MANLDQILMYSAKNDIHYTTAESSSMTLSAGARSTASISYTLPTGATPIAAIPTMTPNAAFVAVFPYTLTTTGVGYAYHNEATVSVTGKFAFTVLYTYE